MYMRLPIHKDLLELILRKISDMFKEKGQIYLSVCYRAIFTAAYYGMLRISEITGVHAIKAIDVHIACNKNKLLFLLRSSKTHNRHNKPQTIKISDSEHGTKKRGINSFCPFHLLRNFINIRPSCKHIRENFFVFLDRSQITSQQVSSVL